MLTVVFGKFCFNFINENPGCLFMTLSVTLGSIELRRVVYESELLE